MLEREAITHDIICSMESFLGMWKVLFFFNLNRSLAVHLFYVVLCTSTLFYNKSIKKNSRSDWCGISTLHAISPTDYKTLDRSIKQLSEDSEKQIIAGRLRRQTKTQRKTYNVMSFCFAILILPIFLASDARATWNPILELGNEHREKNPK